MVVVHWALDRGENRGLLRVVGQSQGLYNRVVDTCNEKGKKEAIRGYLGKQQV